MLIILDRNPVEAARKIPTSIRHKQLLELMQMISCIVNFGYDKIPQGKEIKRWINNHKTWVHTYLITLYNLFYDNVKFPKRETLIKYRCLIDLLECAYSNDEYIEPKTAIFRFIKEYDDKTSYATDSELPIEECIREYQKYVEWKGWE